MTKSIFVTGISGSGKSTLSGELARRGYTSYDIENLKGFFTMVDQETGKVLKNWNNEDLELVKRCKWICNKENLQALMSKQTGELAYYLGSASNANELLPLFNRVIVLKASPEVLRKRLTHRMGNDFARTAEVQEWLLQHKDEWDKAWEKRGAIFVDANRGIQDTASAIIAASKF